MCSKRLNQVRLWLIGALILGWTSPLLAADGPSDVPKPVPATRPEMKAALESLKERLPRISLPAPEPGNSRSTYLPKTWGDGGSLGGFGKTTRRGVRDRTGRVPDPRLDDLFTDPCFWVVSRGNNCHYCLGHQELKLRAGGLDDDTIAALDSNWSIFQPRQRAALAFARKLTLEPESVGDADIALLKKFFSDVEIIELAFNIAQFNAMNRWTDAIGLPQESHISDEGESTLLSPTSEQFQRAASMVTPETRGPRSKLPTFEEAIQAIEKCRDRNARVILPSEKAVAASLSNAIGKRKPLKWELAMAPLVGSTSSQVAMYNVVTTDKHLNVRLKAELALISAINNRAWYATGHAIHRLRGLDVPTEQLEDLFEEDADAAGPSAAHRLAAKLTANPHLIADADIARLREHFSDAETAQVVHVICMANFFDRFSEALGLPLEKDI
jgi:alkylhydroperoxidase family enzyme